MRVLAIGNQKGGSSKTTLAVNLAAARTAASRAVLLVDPDPQRSAAAWMSRQKAVQVVAHDGGGEGVFGAIGRRAIEPLWAHDAPPGSFEIVVVNDGSTDGTSEIAGSCRGPISVRVVRQPNRGIASARNWGAAEAVGDVLLFMDPDVFEQSDLVSAHLRHYGDATTMRAVQGCTFPDPDTLTAPLMRTSNLMPDHTILRRENLSPFHVVGRNLPINRAAYEQIGGLNEGFAGYGYEDVDMAFRFHQAGGRLP